MNIVKKLIKYNYSSRGNNVIKYIIIHDTGNKKVGAGANNHFIYFNGGNRNASADYFVDDKEILQFVEDTNYSWHCGDGKGKYGITNANSIGIEICVNPDSNYKIAVEKTIELVKFLMNKYNIPVENVRRHHDASGKLCPASMSANNWTDWNVFKSKLVTPVNELYRIRKSWDDVKSQIGAYANLETAKKLVDTRKDYNVYDSQGELVYPERKVIMQLEYKRVLRKGMAGEDVRNLQIAIVELGYNPNGIDSSFGNGLDSAIRLFQKNNKLVVDGSVGRATIDKINQLLSGKTDSPRQSTIQPPLPTYEILRPNKQTTVVKILRSSIAKIDVILANSSSNTETVGNMQRRTGCDFIINGGLFWFDKGKAHSLNLLIDEGRQSNAGVYSRYGLITYKDGSYKFGWYAWTNVLKDMLGGSPSLVVDGKINIDKGSMAGGLITARHPRSAIGMDDKYFYLVTIDGRNSAKGLYGMTINELAKYMLSLGCKFATNNDGGGSARLMHDDKLLNKVTENRPVHNAVGIFLK